MQKITFTTRYEQFSKNRGNCPLIDFIEGISSNRSKKQILDLRQLLAEGKAEEAAVLKKKLLAITPVATFTGARLPKNIECYNNLVILDLDDVSSKRMDELRVLINADPYVWASFVSPSACGFKILVRLSGTPPDLTTRNEQGELSGTQVKELAVYHKDAFIRVAAYFEQLLKHPVDQSGKDVTRLCFDSFDPGVYINPASSLFNNEQAVALPADESSATELKTPKTAKPTKKTSAAGEQTPPVTPPDVTRRFNTALRYAQKKGEYVEGNRNNFIYHLFCECNRLAIEQSVAERLVAARFVTFSLDELSQTSQSAYAHTDEHAYYAKKKEEEKKEKKEKEKKVERTLKEIEQFLHERYRFRVNEVTDCTEFAKVKNENWSAVDDRAESTFWRQLKNTKGCEKITQGIIHTLLQSDFCPKHNPFKDYFSSLPAWDGTDYIGQVAERVPVKNQAYFRLCFQKWLVAMVASALEEKTINHTVILLCGAQGCGKTTFASRILPPALRSYFTSARIDPSNKDTLIQLSNKLVINMDELESLSPRKQDELKELITKTEIDVRQAYRMNAKKYVRRASFIASVNNRDILSDTSGSRRFLCFSVEGHIDYETPIHYAGLYAQIYHLFNSGFNYWFNEKEIEELEKNNDAFRVRSTEEELFTLFYRQPRGEESKIALSTAQILSGLTAKTCVSSNSMSKMLLGRIIRKLGFEVKRINGIAYYIVHEVDRAEVEAACKNNAYVSKKVIDYEKDIDDGEDK